MGFKEEYSGSLNSIFFINFRFLTGHRDAVSCVTFGLSNTLFSAGYDRTIKVWDSSQASYIESFFGHQVQLILLTASDKFLACAGDKTCRIWN